ncbi:hypothetical protein E5Q_03262 [Mixia osmundae IAM 14324]|uniref:PLAT domain-containing protein n=1 Tax=Mixia osmundae (strain CBS 9802 / IAM 14324 / JCM 22182 / KY 12970) TaxID=764103 RepID=G7E182_MIXOS|nr:hypothetical protein E5Q_03262 [Mixia osmundae IAM 14324]
MFKSMLALMMLIAAAVASPAPLLANKQPPPKIGPDNDCTFLLLDRYDTDVFEVKFTYHIHYPGNNIDLFNFSGGSAAWHRSSESPDKRTVEHCYKIVRGWDWAIACFRFPRGAPAFTSWYFDSFWTPVTKGDAGQLDTVLIARGTSGFDYLRQVYDKY